MNTDMTVPPAVILGRLPGATSVNATGYIETMAADLPLGTAVLGWHGYAASARHDRTGAAGVFRSRNMTSDPASCEALIRGVYAALRGTNIVYCGDLAGATVATHASDRGLVEFAKAVIATAPKNALIRFGRSLEHWKGLLAPHHYDAMQRHLARLLGDQEELDDEGIVPSGGSLEDLLSFLASRPWARSPALGMTRQGQFAASWSKAGPTRDVSLTFLGDGAVQWYVFGFGKRGKSSAAGSADRLDLPSLLTRLGCDEWLAE